MSRLVATERKQKIVAAAVSLFSVKGFEGTTTRELARKAKISEALLFRHFPDKKSLYKAILSAKMEEQVSSMVQDLPAEPLKKTLEEVARRVFSQNEKDPAFLRLLLFSALEGHELSELFFQKRNLPLLEILKKVLSEGMKSGQLRSMDADLAARTFTAMVFGFIQMRLLFKIPGLVRRSKEEIVNSCVAVFLNGISKRTE
jgi:AcrR family transcriptional regulator